MSNTAKPSCRSCGAPLAYTFVDLGTTPIANDYIHPSQATRMEPFYPLHVFVCDQCYLVQIEEIQTPERIFSKQYAYFSSFSDSWVEHARRYAGMAAQRFGLGPKSQVIEVASNDGYLLQHFVKLGIPVLGIEPTANTAAAARDKGIPTEEFFLGADTARALVARGVQADLLVGNNVLAHVPRLNDFVKGLVTLLAPQGVLTMEFPHLMRLMECNQFDTIYHEHYSYLSLLAVRTAFARHGLRLFDVEEIPTHGGSLRVYAARVTASSRPESPAVSSLLAREHDFGLDRVDSYGAFGEKVKETKRRLLEFLIGVKRQGKRVAGYGAPAKGNTLLNYCGVRTDFIDYTVDRSPHKQGLLLPGTRIPIYPPDRIKETKPDYVLILPWNIREEVMQQMAHIREWGGRFVVPIPEVTAY